MIFIWDLWYRYSYLPRKNKVKRLQYFEKTLSLADISKSIALSILFLTLSNAEIDFVSWESGYMSFITVKTLIMTKWVKLIRKKKFVAVGLGPNEKIFVVYILAFNLDSRIHLSCIFQLAFLSIQNTLITGFYKYSDFANIFSLEFVVELSKHTEINNYLTNPIHSWKRLYKSIHNFGLVKLETLKLYIKTNLANGFIWALKLSVRAPIFLVENSKRSLQLCINY